MDIYAKMMYVKYKNKKYSKRKIIILLATILILGSIGVFLEKKGVINFTDSNKEGLSEIEARTTSSQPSAQSDFTDGDERDPGNTIRENSGSASVTDNIGEINQSISRSNPEVSSTGEITLFAPAKNTSVKEQLHIAGTSTLEFVSYRVVDSISGVISVGELQVVNGQFSGTLNIATGATEGRLDLFGVKDSGDEFSNLAIPLKFN